MNFSSIIKLFTGKPCAAILVFLPAFLLFSCAESLDVEPGLNQVPDGYLTINIAVPEPLSVDTRAGEKDINSLDFFIFSKDGSSFYQHYSVPKANLNGSTIGVPLNSLARDKEVTLYAVANVKFEDTENISTIEGLRTMVIKEDFSEGYPMIGSTVVNTSLNDTFVSLNRTAAKISVSVTDKNAELLEFKLHKFAEKAYLGSPLNSIEPGNGLSNPFKEYIYHDDLSDTPLAQASEHISEPLYVYPSKGVTKEDTENGVFLTLKVKVNDKEQFYRINLRKGDEIKDGILTYYDMEANHWYKVTISEFLSGGYDTEEEALLHPEADQFVAYEIHDHAAEVLSMVTDGFNELGVSPEVKLNTITLENTFIVKCYSPELKEVKADDIEISIPENCKWLKVKSKREHSKEHATIENLDPDANQDWDKDNPGYQFEITLEIPENVSVYDDQEIEITVSWKGLSRKIKVTYEAEFMLQSVSLVTLTIKKNGAEKFSEIKDYWTFIQGLGESSQPDGTDMSGKNKGLTPKLFGIKPEEMYDAKKRINGFHFPMPYGENYKTIPWTYEYEIDFSPLAQLPETGEIIEDITIEMPSDIFWKDKLNWNYKTGDSKGILSFTGSNSYEYAGGTITFHVYFTDTETSSDIIASVYHTGFFHYEGNLKYAPASDHGYYYYEVVPMGNDGEYWLDRNIGAKSNLPYIDMEEEAAADRSSVGRLYTIIEEPQSFKLPKFDFGMCPPGYHVPTQTEWDEVRLNNDFTTQTVVYGNTVYMSTYYNTHNSKIGNVYFQKGRFFNQANVYLNSERYSDEPNVGDAGAGYYWTVTESPAMEKEEMGNWLRSLYLNGSASSYVNASITDHRMPVRCKAGLESEKIVAQDHFISFNVHEVTHVYLFEKDTKTPLYTFPGKAVGTTESAVKWQNFYCTTTLPVEEINMLFVKLESDGKVTVYYKDGNKFKSTVQYDKKFLENPDTYTWPVETGQYYDFCELAQKRNSNISPTRPDDCDTGDENITFNFIPETEDTQTLWQGTHYCYDWGDNNSDLANNNFDWSKVEPGTKLKIYTGSLGGEFILQVFNGNWSRIGEYRDGNSEVRSSTVEPIDNKIRVVEIVLTKSLINNFANNKGLIIQGTNFAIIGVTLAPKDPDYKEDPPYEFIPDSESEIVIWSATDNGTVALYGWSNKFEDLHNDIAWVNKLSVGKYIKTYSRSLGNNYNLQVVYGNWWNNTKIVETGYRDDGKIKIQVTQQLLDNIRDHQGLVWFGDQCELLGITISDN